MGLTRGYYIFPYWIAKRQTKKGPIISQANSKGSYIDRHVHHFMHRPNPFFKLVSDSFRPLRLKPIKDIGKEGTDLPTNM
jgi:hypothetical protein